MTKKHTRPYVYFYICFFAFILAINLLMLPMQDDWYQWVRSNTTFSGDELEYIKQNFGGVNARLGEFFFKLFTRYIGNSIFENKLIFGAVNAIFFCGLIANLFYLIKGSYPTATKKDILLTAFLFTAIYFSSHFSMSFVWMAGAFNYAWALFFASCWALPYRHYLAPPPIQA